MMSAAYDVAALPLDTILLGDCLAVLRTLPDNSIDAIVTDPPAGVGFMGVAWDTYGTGKGAARADDAWDWTGSKERPRTAQAQQRVAAKQGRAFRAAMEPIFTECLRVLKPGGHALVWALPRTSHWTATALEDAGFEIRDRVSHFFGSGFPKSLDVSKAIDKQAGAKRKVTGTSPNWRESKRAYAAEAWEVRGANAGKVTAPATDAARARDGWGTALKPAVEDWWLVRKPLSERNVAANVLRWGVGALNIEASRVATDDATAFAPSLVRDTAAPFGKGYAMGGRGSSQGRWPSHLLLSHSIWCSDGGCAEDCPIRALDAQSGITASKRSMRGNLVDNRSGHYANANGARIADSNSERGHTDTGGASRYFQQFAYVPKASRSERNRGCEEIAPTRSEYRLGDPDENSIRTRLHGSRATANHHPTVKPLALMTWLIRLITPTGGVVLDPFAGSGSTLVAARDGGWRYIGIERETEYVAIAEARLAPPVLALMQQKPKRRRKAKVSA